MLQTAVGLCVFLAYGTTASVARHLGAGDTRGALAQGIDGIWLAVLIGTVTTVLGVALTTPWSSSSAPAPRSRSRQSPTCGSPSSAPPRCW